jgi:hypothetical protein
MYSNTAAQFRADLTGALVEQASSYEQNLIGTKVMPVINVDSKSGLYPIFNVGAGNLLRNDVKARAPYASFARQTHAFDQDTFNCLEYGMESAVDDVISTDMSRFYDSNLVASKFAMRKVSIGHEIRVATALFNTTNFGSATNSGTAWTIANISTFDAGLDVELALDRIRADGESTTEACLVCSSQVFTRIKASTKLQNRLRGIGLSSDTFLNASEQAVADALGLKAVYVGRAFYDASNEGSAYSSSAIWNNTYAWVGNIGNAGNTSAMFGGGAAFTLNWGQYGNVLAVETYRDERITADIVRAKHCVIEKIVNGNAGDLIATQYT